MSLGSLANRLVQGASGKLKTLPQRELNVPRVDPHTHEHICAYPHTRYVREVGMGSCGGGSAGRSVCC